MATQQGLSKEITFEVVATGLSFPEGPIVCDDGSLIVCEVGAGRLTRITRDGKLQQVADTGGSPSGLAVGPDGALYCCNGGGYDWSTADQVPRRSRPLPNASVDAPNGSIQRVNVSTGVVETVIEAYEGMALGGPNDLMFTPDGGFWFTDFGSWLPQSMHHGGLYHVYPSGEIRRVNFGISLNGVGVSPDGQTVYASATFERWVLAFDTSEQHREQAGRLVADFPGRQFLDSLAIEQDGTIAQACLNERHGIVRINPRTGDTELIETPDELTTNIAFGGVGMRSAYLTFSEAGAVAKCEWPTAGLRLPFNI